MRSQTRRALKLVVEKARRLLTGPYVQQLQERSGTQLSYSWRRGQRADNSTFSMDYSHPDDVATEALVLTFRFFIHGKEISSFKSLAKHVLDDPGLSDEWKQGFANVRNQLNTFLDAKSSYRERVVAPAPEGGSDNVQLVGEYHWTHFDILDIIIYGGMAHAEEKKWEIYERWTRGPFFPVVQAEFDNVIMVVLHAIADLCYLSERELAAPEAPSQ